VVGVPLDVLVSGFFFFSLEEITVGGSCRGSPARMSFDALRMGIQQTASRAYGCLSKAPLRD
jgi:hypothetical protein